MQHQAHDVVLSRTEKVFPKPSVNDPKYPESRNKKKQIIKERNKSVKEGGANQSERDEVVYAMPCRVSRVSRGQSSWPKGPKKSGQSSSGVASRRSVKAPSREKRDTVKKDGSKEKVIAFPETAVSLIYRTQKSKDDKRKKKIPIPIPYAMQCIKGR
jgi:hypothetical protein